jgi:hypothetical protein
MRFPTRRGVCGLGVPNEISFYAGTLPGECRAGLARVVLTGGPGAVRDVDASVGGNGEGDAIDTDPAWATRYLLSLVPRLDAAAAARAVQAAAMAEGGASAAQLLALARDGSLAPETRRMAVTWAGIVAGAAGDDALAELARDEAAERSVREQALIALDMAGVPVALHIARTSGDARMRETALHRAALRLPATELVRLYGTFADAPLRRRIVDVVASRGDAGAKRSLLEAVERDPDPEFRVRAAERLGRG